MDKQRKPDKDGDTYGYRDFYKDSNAFIYGYINQYADERAADSHIYKYNTIGDLYPDMHKYCCAAHADKHADNTDKYRYADMDNNMHGDDPDKPVNGALL